MIKVGGGWESEFPNKSNTRMKISKDSGQVTVASYKSLTGGHAMLYLEYIDGMGFAVTRKMHLVAGVAGSGASVGASGTTQIEIIDEEKDVGRESDTRSDEYLYQSFSMTDKQLTALEAATLRFKAKNIKGRYSYRIAGGVIGRLTSRPKTRGVNCADFIIKVLKEAGITKLSSDIFNSPARIAGRSGRS